MKKILAMVLCVCIALTITVSAMAASSPKTRVLIRKGTAFKYDGSSITEDAFTDIAEDGTITVKADEKTYGKFNKWTIYALKANPTTGENEYVEAVAGVDYIIVSGSLESNELEVKPISEITVAGNYAGTTTDPTKESEVDTNVIVRKATATREDGTSFPSDKYVYVPVGTVVTAAADEATYGKFTSWSIYTIDETATAATSGKVKVASILNLATAKGATAAVAGTDYEIVDGNLKSKTIKVKVLTTKKLAVCANYAGTTTDPLSLSSTQKAPKHGDVSVMYAVIVLLAAGAVLFGAKRQLSK